MISLRSRFALLALAATSSAAFAQFTYNSATYAEASAFGYLDVPGPYGIYTSTGSLEFYYGTYASATWNTQLDPSLLPSGFQGAYGQDTCFAYSANVDNASFISGVTEAQSGGDMTLGQYQYSSDDYVSAGANAGADFNITAGGIYDFSAYGFYVPGMGYSNLVYLRDAVTFVNVFSFSNFNGLLTWNGYVGPGEYQLVGFSGSAYGNADTYTWPGGFSYLSYGFGPQPQQNGTPAPLAAIPFALGALLRRRRRS